MIQIKVKDLSFSYSGFRALQDISFEAGAGDMLAIIGQNGSGKSTLLKCISRILKINTGHIEIGNISLSALSASKLSRDSRLYSPINRLDQRDQCVRYGTIGT